MTGRMLRRLGSRSLRAVHFSLRVAPFWARVPLFRWTPGGFGYSRGLRRYVDPSYDWLRDRHPVRLKHRGAEALGRPDAAGFISRNYASYEEYVVHQRQKLDEILLSGEGFSNAVVAAYRSNFYRRFRHLIHRLPAQAVIICLGARQGTEVEVLRELGFRNAYGIDLNPGPDNALVHEGDFHNIGVPDGSVDLVYSNSLDHAFDLDRFFTEHRRVLKSDGFALYDIHTAYQPGQKAPFEATLWTRPEEVVKRAFDHFGRILKLEAAGDWTWILLQNPFPTGPATNARRRYTARRELPSAQHGRPRPQRTGALAKIALTAALLISALTLLPEALGDHPYNAFGHDARAHAKPNT